MEEDISELFTPVKVYYDMDENFTVLADRASTLFNEMRSKRFVMFGYETEIIVNALTGKLTKTVEMMFVKVPKNSPGFGNDDDDDDDNSGPSPGDDFVSRLLKGVNINP